MGLSVPHWHCALVRWAYGTMGRTSPRQQVQLCSTATAHRDQRTRVLDASGMTLQRRPVATGPTSSQPLARNAPGEETDR